MSIMLSISSILSFLSFLTTVLALARVGAAAFASNQSHMQQQLQRLQLVASGGDDNGLLLPRRSQLSLSEADEKGTVASEIEKLKGLVGAGGDFMRLPSWGSLRKPRLTFPPAALLEEPQEPLSMAKLIMSRHSQRRPGRPSAPRRPPGLASTTLPKSRLVEEAAE